MRVPADTHSYQYHALFFLNICQSNKKKKKVASLFHFFLCTFPFLGMRHTASFLLFTTYIVLCVYEFPTPNVHFSIGFLYFLKHSFIYYTAWLLTKQTYYKYFPSSFLSLFVIFIITVS